MVSVLSDSVQIVRCGPERARNLGPGYCYGGENGRSGTDTGIPVIRVHMVTSHNYVLIDAVA